MRLPVICINILLLLLRVNQKIEDIAWCNNSTPISTTIANPPNRRALFGSPKDGWNKDLVEALRPIGCAHFELLFSYLKISRQFIIRKNSFSNLS
jgi:hypothetical protein